MARVGLAPAFLALALAVAAAPSGAVDAPKVLDVKLLDEEGENLRIVGAKDVVTIRAIVNNTGDTATNGTLQVRFVVDNGKGTQWTQTVRRNVVVGPGNETTVDYRWPTTNRQVGNHSVTITILGAADPGITAFFEVAETSVRSGSVVERFLEHYWFFGAFALALVLFVAVLAARRA